MKNKEQKRNEAQERMELSNSLSISQKIVRLDKGNFAAKKERKKLENKKENK